MEEELRRVVRERDSLKSALTSLEEDYHKAAQEAKVSDTAID